MGRFVAIVLAAGESKRMGEPKMLLDFGGKTMIERVLDNVKAPEIDRIIIVLGANREKIADKLNDSSLIYSYNEKFTEGMLSSVICGVRSVPEEPFINKSVISILVKAYSITGKGIVIPLFNGKRGHPLLIGKKYFHEIEQLDASEGLRALSRKHDDDVFTVDTNEPGILRDFDTKDDYNKINS
jgi:molybdenum cofactor cytidylyltransferase